jgi:carboxymethylenebutenolidase
MSSNDMQQGVAGLPPSNLTADARLKGSPRHAEWVKIPWGDGKSDSLMAWIVYPASPNARTKAPVVVVVHEVFGLSPWVRGVADQVAADGFIAIAPDILSRVRGGPSTVDISGDSGRKIIGGVSNADRSQAVTAAANYGMMLPSATQKYAVMGYCWGGSTSWYHAVNGGVKGFSGAVPYYGLPYTTQGTPATATTAAVPGGINADSLAKIKVPVMMLSGAGDARIGAAMPAVDSIMKSMKKDYAGTNYPGAIHGFLRAQDDAIAPPQGRNGAPPPPPRSDESIKTEQAANLAATKDGWPKTIAFLKKNLGVK